MVDDSIREALDEARIAYFTASVACAEAYEASDAARDAYVEDGDAACAIDDYVAARGAYVEALDAYEAGRGGLSGLNRSGLCATKRFGVPVHYLDFTDVEV